VARDPLQVLLRLRGIALDTARRALADRLREEAAATDRSAAIAATIAHETQAQARQPAETRSLESYAAWLARTQVAQREAQAAARACASATADARTSLNEARAGARALESALEHAREARRDAAARLEQQAIDEAAAGYTRPGRWSG
jgi:flagellar export protein FliJ